jgi:hypothetical protein
MHIYICNIFLQFLVHRIAITDVLADHMVNVGHVSKNALLATKCVATNVAAAKRSTCQNLAINK